MSVNQVQKKKRSNLEGGFGAADDVGREGRGGVDQVEFGTHKTAKAREFGTNKTVKALFGSDFSANVL